MISPHPNFIFTDIDGVLNRSKKVVQSCGSKKKRKIISNTLT
jgi:histidinol phosphatase-like enzyme